MPGQSNAITLPNSETLTPFLAASTIELHKTIGKCAEQCQIASQTLNTNRGAR